MMSKKIAITAATLMILPVAPGVAHAAQVSPVQHHATAKECSACHMVFPPQFLPQRSWKALMANLSDHFGEDASLSKEVAADIEAYLVANAADAPDAGISRRILRGLSAEDTPLRITETPWWKRAHDEISQARYARPDVKSPANCAACHRGADQGRFEEEEGFEEDGD
jgi:hypothetical protein